MRAQPAMRAPTASAQELFSLASRVALVTGGGTGLGAAFAKGLVNAGASVVVCGRREAPLQETVRAIEDEFGPGRCHAVQCDLEEADAAARCVAEAAAHFGGAPTILVNNAGINVRVPAAELTPAHWQQSLGLMLTAPSELARACAPAMKAAGYGRIINVASLQSTLAFPDSMPYAAAKSGVLGLTRALAEAYSPKHGYDGVTCNAIAPGYVRTELTAAVFADEERAARLAAKTMAGRNSVPDDLVGPAIFLASPAAAYVTGQCLNVDGGFTALGLS